VRTVGFSTDGHGRAVLAGLSWLGVRRWAGRASSLSARLFPRTGGGKAERW